MKRHTLLVLLAALGSLGAAYQSDNFLVEAPTDALAERIALQAEQQRKEQALLWLGEEMPPWSRPCPLHVTMARGRPSGGTSFAFDRGQVLCIDMHIKGSLDLMLASILPHEVTHTVFAHHFRCPIPRWADEGGSVLSEDRAERRRHDFLARQILQTPGRAIPLRRLFQLREYPDDVMALYAEGYSVTRFLVAARDRSTFLAFVRQGMDEGWDEAVREHYDYDSIDALEKAWLESLSGQGKPAEKGPAQRKAAKPDSSEEADSQPASLLVHLPAEAKLFIDDEPTQSRSSPRRFHTPPLDPSRDFHYTLRAEVNRNGKRVSIRKTVTVRAGETTTVTLSFPPG